MDELQNELNKRGTAEVVNGKACQVTQALSETDEEVTFLMFGERKTQKVRPIEEACADCNFWRGKFDCVGDCQRQQRKDGSARGFHKLTCPQQLI